MTRFGVVSIIVTDKESVLEIQSNLTKFSDIIVGRMGVPDKESGVNAICLIVKGALERISALCGILGKIEGVYVKSALSSYGGKVE